MRENKKLKRAKGKWSNFWAGFVITKLKIGEKGLIV